MSTRRARVQMEMPSMNYDTGVPRAHNPYDDMVATTVASTEREYPVQEEEPFLGTVLPAEFFERIQGFTYSNLEDKMVIKTIPRYADNAPTIMIEEFHRPSKTHLRAELEHFNIMYKMYLDQESARRERVRDIRRRQEAVRASESITQRLMRTESDYGYDECESVEPERDEEPRTSAYGEYDRYDSYGNDRHAGTTPDHDRPNSDGSPRARLMDSIFGVREPEEPVNLREEIPEEVEAPALSFQSGSRTFMNGNNHDE